MIAVNLSSLIKEEIKNKKESSLVVETLNEKFFIKNDHKNCFLYNKDKILIAIIPFEIALKYRIDTGNGLKRFIVENNINIF